MASYQKLRATKILSNFFNLSGIQLSNILLLILITPIITRKIGIFEFGLVSLATRYLQLAGSIINFGTGQSGVKDTAFNLTDTKKLSEVFYTTLFIRTIIFLLFLALFLAIRGLHIPYYNYFLLAVPVALAEVFNPLCFFIGAERLRIFNICNLLFNVAAVLALIVFIKGKDGAIWVNFILGTGNMLTYLVLLVYFGKKFKLPFYLPQKNELLSTGKANFYLTTNNISVNLQQSLIIFALPRWGYTALLGPYTLCDKIIGQCRNLLVTLSNALYPKAAHIYKQSSGFWDIYRRKMKFLIAGVFFAGSILIFVLADFIVFLLSKDHNQTAVLFLRIMAFVPAISALNVLNVLDQLLKNNNVYIFRIALILFIVSAITALALLSAGNSFFIGAFTLIIEICAWLMYEYIIKKPAIQNG